MARATRWRERIGLAERGRDEEEQAAQAEVREHAVDPRRAEEVREAREWRSP
jgi:hypothetical protein